MRNLLTVSLALLLAWAGSVPAATRVVPIEGVRAIDDGEGSFRVLLKLAPIEGLGSMAISRAYLAVDTERRGELTRPIVVQVHPITRDWSPGAVDWTTGWTRPGGDFEDEFYTRSTLQPGEAAGEYRIDVESLIREMRHEPRFHGLVVTAAPYRGSASGPRRSSGSPGCPSRGWSWSTSTCRRCGCRIG